MKTFSKRSWTAYFNEGIFIKKMDKSTFLHHGTGFLASETNIVQELDVISNSRVCSIYI